MISASVAYFFKMVMIDLQEALYALLQIVVFIGFIYVAFVAILLRYKISEIFDKLALIYDACKNELYFIHLKKIQCQFTNCVNYLNFNSDKSEENFKFLLRINDICDWLWKMYLNFGTVGFSVYMIFTSIGSVLLCLCLHGSFIKNKLFLPMKVRYVNCSEYFWKLYRIFQ